MNTNQEISTTVFFNFKKHLIKAFFDKIKTDNRIFKIFVEYVDMGIKRAVLQSLIQRSKRFSKNI